MGRQLLVMDLQWRIGATYTDHLRVNDVKFMILSILKVVKSMLFTVLCQSACHALHIIKVNLQDVHKLILILAVHFLQVLLPMYLQESFNISHAYLYKTSILDDSTMSLQN